MALFKYIVLSVCLCGIHLNGFAQSTREAILEDIARPGGVYYAYPVKVRGEKRCVSKFSRSENI